MSWREVDTYAPAMIDVSANLGALHSSIAAACARAGRDLQTVQLVAVSKTVGLAEVSAAIQAGVHDFAENRTSLLLEKQAAYPEERWHFIGRIQTNKLKDIVGRATLIHSLASERALLAVAKHAERLGRVQDVLIEVNVSGEESKDGVSVKELSALLDQASNLASISVRGLMTMAPQGNADRARVCFARLRELRDEHRVLYAGCKTISLAELSMGMSEDFEIAVEEGATILRIGRSVWR